MNRDHYDSVRWTIGSIFIVGSLTLFGISFVEPVVRMPLQVALLAGVSVILFGVFAAYHLHVEPYVKMSIRRLQMIEKELQTQGYVSPLPDSELELFKDYQRDPKNFQFFKRIPRLHTMICAITSEGRGTWIFPSLALLLLLYLNRAPSHTMIRISVGCSVVAPALNGPYQKEADPMTLHIHLSQDPIPQ